MLNSPDFKDTDQLDDSANFGRFFSLFINNWYWFAITLLLTLSLAYGVNRYSPKVYSVSSTMLISDSKAGESGEIATAIIPGGDIFRNEQNLKNEMQIIKSFKLNYMVMQKLKDFHVSYMAVGRRGIVESVMYRDSPFVIEYDSVNTQPVNKKIEVLILDENTCKLKIEGNEESAEIKFGSTFDKNGFKFIIRKRYPGSQIYSDSKSNKYYFFFNDLAGLANSYRSKLTVQPREQESSLISLTITGFVPAQLSDYLNTLMEVYRDYGLSLKKEIASQTINFINGQLDVISDSLENAADKLENFRKANKLISPNNKIDLLQSRYEETLNELASTELQAKYYNYLSDYLKSRSTDQVISPSVLGITDQVLLGLVSEFSALTREKKNISLNLNENQPAMDLAENKIEEIRSSLQENIKNCISSLNINRTGLMSRISQFENEMQLLLSTERRYVDIQRQFDLNNTIYTYLLEKRAESGIAQASTFADNRIIDYAQMAGQIRPKTKNNYLIALIFGLALPGGAIVVLDMFYNRVVDKRDIEKKTRVPVIGFINHSEGSGEVAVVEKPGSSLTESFRSVRTALRYFVKEGDSAVISVSSTISSEGKTFISVNLAAVLAMLDKNVLLVGLDMRKPRINDILTYEKSPGMSSFLSGNCKYEDIIRKTQVRNLFYAPSGPIPPNPAELLEKKEFADFIKRAKKDYDYIVIDTPPVAIVTDALLISKQADINLFIVRQRYTRVNTLEIVEHISGKSEMKNMAIIINDISLTGYYGYGLRYGYSGYGYTYGYNYYGAYSRLYGYKDDNQYYVKD